MRAAIYGRVSTRDKQEVDNQLRQLRTFCEQQGWPVYGECVDRETGSTSDRQEFQAMFHDAAQRRFDLVLFWARDRLSREGVLETLQHLNRLTSYGVGFRSFTEPYFDSCGVFKDAVIAIIATVAKQERIRMGERIRAGLATARAKAKRLGRPSKVVDAAKAKIAALRARGLGYKRIARQLGLSARTVRRVAQAAPQWGAKNMIRGRWAMSWPVTIGSKAFTGGHYHLIVHPIRICNRSSSPKGRARPRRGGG
jgi:DNA invertase Pin-like site-specific DNA recombinase